MRNIILFIFALASSRGFAEASANKTYEFKDSSGSYQLVLQAKQDVGTKDDKMSSSIQARLMNGSKVRLALSDKTDGPGIQFLLEQTETSDIDGDGLIDPIFVYRIYAVDDQGKADFNAYRGQLKMVLLYKKQKVVIRAITGTLDDERSTKATANYFSLPKKIREYLVAKMKKMYDQDIFGFDNTYQFVPRK